MRALLAAALCTLPFTAVAEGKSGDFTLEISTLYAITSAGGGDRHAPAGDAACAELYGDVPSRDVTGSYSIASEYDVSATAQIAGEEVRLGFAPARGDGYLLASDMTPSALLDDGVSQVILQIDANGENPRMLFELVGNGDPVGAHCYLADRLPD